MLKLQRKRGKCTLSLVHGQNNPINGLHNRIMVISSRDRGDYIGKTDYRCQSAGNILFCICIKTIWILVGPLLSWSFTVSGLLCVISFPKRINARDTERSGEGKIGKGRETREGERAGKIQGADLPLCFLLSVLFHSRHWCPNLSECPRLLQAAWHTRSQSFRPVRHPFSLQVVTLTLETGNT